MYALIIAGLVWELFPSDPRLSEDMDVRDVSKVAGIKVGWSAKTDGTYAAPATVEPGPAPVPDVTSAQAKIQLLRASFLVPVQEAVKAIGGETEIWFNDARTWQRNNPHVVEIGAGLNLKPAEIDDLFRAAALIDA